METPTILVVNVETGEEEHREMTPEEIEALGAAQQAAVAPEPVDPLAGLPDEATVTVAQLRELLGRTP
ncbi:MAG TPA: hypothetical protein VLI07_18870 [Candidatus Binatus sp.]|nr:hypothetical protein [Candidatus Binatus sp.]